MTVHRQCYWIVVRFTSKRGIYPGIVINVTIFQVRGSVVLADPYDGCTQFNNANDVSGKIVVVRRGACLFIDKARIIQSLGGVGGIVIGKYAVAA